MNLLARLTQDKFNRWLTAIVVAGFLLRVHGLGKRSLWTDEGASFYYAQRSVHWLLTTPENNPPLYRILLHFWIQIFGDSEFSLRFPSVIFGTACIVLFAMVARQLFNTQTALLSATLMAVSVFPVHYSQDARAFTQFLLAVLGSFYFLIKALENNRWKHWIAYGLCASVMSYSHNYFVFTLLGQNVYVLLYHRESRVLKCWISAQAGVLCLFLPWALILYQQTQKVMTEGFWIEPQNFNLKIIRSYVAFLVHPYFVWLYVAVAGWGVLHLSAKDSNRFKPDDRSKKVKRNPLLILWLLCPLLVPFLISHIATPILHPRYTIGAMPAFFLYIAYGFCKLPSRWLRAIAIMIGASIALLSIYNYKQLPSYHQHRWFAWYAAFPEEPYREWALFLKNEIRPDDALLVAPFDGSFGYYSIRYQLDYTLVADEKGAEHNALFEAWLLSQLQGKSRVWFLLRGNSNVSSTFQILNKHYKLTRHDAHYPNRGLSLHLFIAPNSHNNISRENAHKPQPELRAAG